VGTNRIRNRQKRGVTFDIPLAKVFGDDKSAAGSSARRSSVTQSRIPVLKNSTLLFPKLLHVSQGNASAKIIDHSSDAMAAVVGSPPLRWEVGTHSSFSSGVTGVSLIGSPCRRLQEALVKSERLLPRSIYKHLDVVANQAISNVSAFGSSGSSGSSGARDHRNDRALNANAENMCRAITELCLALDLRPDYCSLQAPEL
jgi:hypothetical protein